jgi:hypothetical protein
VGVGGDAGWSGRGLVETVSRRGAGTLRIGGEGVVVVGYTGLL